MPGRHLKNQHDYTPDRLEDIKLKCPLKICEIPAHTGLLRKLIPQDLFHTAQFLRHRETVAAMIKGSLAAT